MGLFDRARREPAVEEELAARTPPGQTLTDKWPVLTYGETPRIATADWRLSLSGLVEEPRQLTWQDLMALPATRQTCDMHCVTRWSKLGNDFEGVRLKDLLADVPLKPEAAFVMAHSYGGYTTNVPLRNLLEDDVMLAYRYDGAPLAPEHGGPCRLLVPKLYLWKSAKWINGLEFLAKDRAGFWERAGYHMHGDPWTEQRHGWGL